MFFGDFFGAFFELVLCFFDVVTAPLGEVELLSAAIDMPFEPPGYGRYLCIPRVLGVVGVAVVAACSYAFGNLWGRLC